MGEKAGFPLAERHKGGAVPFPPDLTGWFLASLPPGSPPAVPDRRAISPGDSPCPPRRPAALPGQQHPCATGPRSAQPGRCTGPAARGLPLGRGRSPAPRPGSHPPPAPALLPGDLFRAQEGSSPLSNTGFPAPSLQKAFKRERKFSRAKRGRSHPAGERFWRYRGSETEKISGSASPVAGAGSLQLQSKTVPVPPLVPGGLSGLGFLHSKAMSLP